MVLGALRDGLYNVVLLLHIVAFLVAFAPAVVHPVVIARVRQAGGDAEVTRAARWMEQNGRQIHLPALLAIAVLGVLLVLLSDDAWGFDQTWVWLALVVWFAIGGVVSNVMVPAEKRLADGDLTAEKRIAAGGQVVTLLTVVVLYLMIWKPGL